MSDGLSEAHAFERMQQKLEKAALDLYNAIRDAQDGYRGTVISNIAETVNEELKGCGYQLVRKRP
jgi:hypothetical protein